MDPATKHLQEWSYVNTELERKVVSETRSTVAKHTRGDNVNCSARQRLLSCYKRAYHESTQLPGIQGGRGALHPNQGDVPTTAFTPGSEFGGTPRHQEKAGKVRDHT